jgi:uncharacterized membrane protein YqjE
MAEPSAGLSQLATNSKQLARRLLTIGENRLELLRAEAQEGRDRLLQTFLLALGVAVFGLLGGMTLSAAIVVWLWPYTQLGALLGLAGLYAVGGICLWWRLATLLRDWESFAASLDQLRKDRACLEKLLT